MSMILIIDNYDSFTYNLYQGIAQLDPDIKVVRNDKITVQEIIEMHPDGIVLSPGPGRPEDAGICVELVRTFDERKIKDIPLLGVCLGLQSITIALGGKVVQAHEIVHGKRDFIFHNRQGIYAKLPLPFAAGRYHSLMAARDSLPNNVLIEAENANRFVMGIRHADLPIFGVQFHPESILTPEGNVLLVAFLQSCKKRENNNAKESC